MGSRHWACLGLPALAVLLVLSGRAPTFAQSDDLTALNQQIEQLYQIGKYDEAIALAQRLVELTGTRFGNEHPVYAHALDVLGDLYREKGRYAEAEPLYKSARNLLEKQFGPEHRE